MIATCVEPRFAPLAPGHDAAPPSANMSTADKVKKAKKKPSGASALSFDMDDEGEAFAVKKSKKSVLKKSKAASDELEQCSGAWEDDEHTRFLCALAKQQGAVEKKEKKWDWKAVETEVRSRTATQCRTHHQKWRLKAKG